MSQTEQQAIAETARRRPTMNHSTTAKALKTAAVLGCLLLTVGCRVTSPLADNAQPPTGWTDLRFAQTSPGNCQDHAYDYCRRLLRRGIEAKVMMVSLPERGLHAVVETVDRKGRPVYVDTTTGDVCYARNYTDGDVISKHAFVRKPGVDSTEVVSVAAMADNG